MTKRIFLFSLLFSFYYAHSQHQIIDIESKEPVSYAHVKIMHEAKGKIANFKGEFDLDSTFYLFDTLRISCIGYENKFIPISSLKQYSVIELIPNTQSLNEVAITAKKFKYQLRKIGVRRKPKNEASWRSGSPITHINGVERVWWIPNEYSISGRLNAINVYVTDVGYPDADFRVHIYECTPLETKPGKELTKSNIISSGTKGNEWVNINVKKENIQILENGCFIGIEWFDSPKAIYFRDTLHAKGIVLAGNKPGGKERDTIYTHYRIGNGVAIGTVLEAYKYAKNKIWLHNNGEWFNWGIMDESKFNIPDTLPTGHISIRNEYVRYQIACINLEVSFKKDKIKSIYQPPKKRKMNKIAKVKEDRFKYPQSNVSELFSSLIKAFENDDITYALRYLFLYKEDEFNDMLEESLVNKEDFGDIIPISDKVRIIGRLKEIHQQLQESSIYKIYDKHFELITYDASYALVVEDGLWKINPFADTFFKYWED